MKYATKEKASAANNIPTAMEELKQKKNRDLLSEMKPVNDTLSDALQASVVTHSGRAISILEQNQIEAGKIDYAKDSISALRNFYYNIGFAGGQSSGKSTMINAIIQYPLMAMCKQATTCTPVEMIYSDKIRIIVRDDDSNKVVLDYDCHACSEDDFKRLLCYACEETAIGRIENLQYFTNVNILDRVTKLEPHELDMQHTNPKHVAILVMILLTVYVNQNQSILTETDKYVIELREKTLRYFGIPQNIYNMSVTIQWDLPLLKSGLKITDLPGLGSNAGDLKLDNGRTIKGHDTITGEAIAKTDTMVVLNDPLVTGEVMKAVKAMLSELSTREAVNPGSCIIPVLNKVDCCGGEAVKQNALHSFSLSMENAGVHKAPEDIFCTSSWYGEADYLEIDHSPDNVRSLYCMVNAANEKHAGATQEEIEESYPIWNKQLQRKFDHSGIKPLREFFQSFFLDKGKFEKSFTVLAAMKALETDLLSTKQSLIDSNIRLIDIDSEIATQALRTLQRDAQTPISDSAKSLSAMVLARKKKAAIVQSLVNQSTESYLAAFDAALKKYIRTNREIAEQFMVGTRFFHGDEANIDAGPNVSVYEDLKLSCKTLDIDLTSVNKTFAEALHFCDTDIEEIYSTAMSWLEQFGDQYEKGLREKIDSYRNSASTDIIHILEEMVPVLSTLVANVISTADSSLEEGRSNLKKAEKEITDIISERNRRYVAAHRDFLISQVNTSTGGFFFSSHEYIKVKGTGGILEALTNTNLSDADREIIKQELDATCMERIVVPMQGWYADAQTSINTIYADLQLKIEDLFKTTNALILASVKEREAIITEVEKEQKLLKQIFADMRAPLVPIFQQLQNEKPAVMEGTKIHHWVLEDEK